MGFFCFFIIDVIVIYENIALVVSSRSVRKSHTQILRVGQNLEDVTE